MCCYEDGVLLCVAMKTCRLQCATKSRPKTPQYSSVFSIWIIGTGVPMSEVSCVGYTPRARDGTAGVKQEEEQIHE